MQDIIKLNKERWVAEGRPGAPASKPAGRRLASSEAAAAEGTGTEGAETVAAEAALEAAAARGGTRGGSSVGGGRRRLLAYAKSHPLAPRCDVEKTIKQLPVTGDRRALQQCLNSIEVGGLTAVHSSAQCQHLLWDELECWVGFQ